MLQNDESGCGRGTFTQLREKEEGGEGRCWVVQEKKAGTWGNKKFPTYWIRTCTLLYSEVTYKK